jgi:hypothetical protein
MKTAIALIILIALYFSFFFGDGVLYDASQNALNWFNAEHSKNAYLGLMLLLAGIALYLFALDKSDKRKAEHITDELIKNIKETGVYAATTENTGFGEVHLQAMITFQDSGFILQVTQKSNDERAAILVDKKFLSWVALVKYLEQETKFSLTDFLPKAGPEIQLPREDATIK